MYFIILVSMCSFLAPTKNNERFTAFTELGQEESDESENSTNAFDDLDAEFGNAQGNTDEDPWKPTGALDVEMASLKRH